MTRRAGIILFPFLAAAASLFVGLAPTLLDKGRFEPLDWLVPGFVALAAMRFVGGPQWVRAACHWALVALPPVLVTGLAASVVPWTGLALLAGLLAAGAFLLARAWRRPWLVALAWVVMLGALRLGADMAGDREDARPTRHIAVMTSLPLFQAQQGGGGLLHGLGVRAPLLLGLQRDLAPSSIDRLDAASLRGFGTLLLAQPRLLAPAELVALDDWVRAGGEVVILADPLLRWPDERPLFDPSRPPVTSLLDPLMTHWGLTLEPARMDAEAPVERRLLSSGALVQFAGASRFTPAPRAPCRLAEKGLIAYCRVGKGKAVLIADADWIDDRLWTRRPERPRDRRGWTSDALPLLSGMIAGKEALPGPSGAWLRSPDGLVSALRWALASILLLSLMLARMARAPISAHVPPMPQEGAAGNSRAADPDSS